MILTQWAWLDFSQMMINLNFEIHFGILASKTFQRWTRPTKSQSWNVVSHSHLHSRTTTLSNNTTTIRKAKILKSWISVCPMKTLSKESGPRQSGTTKRWEPLKQKIWNFRNVCRHRFSVRVPNPEASRWTGTEKVIVIQTQNEFTQGVLIVGTNVDQGNFFLPSVPVIVTFDAIWFFIKAQF